MTPEGRVKAQIKKALDGAGLWRAGAARPKVPDKPIGWYFMPAANGLGVSGIPDFVGHLHGAFFSIEAKAPGGKTTANQDQRHIEIHASGGVVMVINDALVVEEWLRERLAAEKKVRHQVRELAGAGQESRSTEPCTS